MKALGIDHGDARIGLAVSDDLGMLAHPLETIAIKDVADPLARIAAIVERDKITAIILGLPRNMDGLRSRRGEVRLRRQLQPACRASEILTSGSPPSPRSARSTRSDAM